MGTFEYCYGVNLGRMLLKHSDNLSCTYINFAYVLCRMSVSSNINHKNIDQSLPEEAFSRFWERCKKAATELKINKSVLSRKRQCLIRYFVGETPSEFCYNVKHHYWQVYFDIIDTVVML